MHTTPINRAIEAAGRLKTHFPIVPIEQVPVAQSAADAVVDRPVVLVVEDDSVIADTLVQILNQSGYAAIAAYDGIDAVETALLVPPDLVITDVALNGMSGIEVAVELKSKLPACKIMLLGAEHASDAQAAAELGELVFAVVEKPVHPAELLEKVSASLKSREKASTVEVA